MKRFAIISALFLLFSAAGRGQQASDFSVYVSSGYAIPASPMTFANFWSMQYGGGAGIGYALSPSVTAVASVEHYRFALDKKGVQEGFDTEYMRSIWIFSDVSLAPSADPSSVTTISANLRAAAGSGRFLTPYLSAGAGVMLISMSEISIPTTSTITLGGTTLPVVAERRITGGDETSAFVQVGIGAEFRLSERILPFIEARYGLGLTKGIKTNYLPITAGIHIQL